MSSSGSNPISASQELTRDPAMDEFYNNTMYNDIILSMQSNIVSGTNISPSGVDPMIGLRLGNPNDYGDSLFPHHSGKSFISSSVPISSTPLKRSRASYQHMQNPCCQVEGCNLDLKSAKDYHRRHRICESHSKSPKVIVAGMERRFCQQCSRFHGLSEFDDKKRSCRRRLSDHNARRRRVQPESIQITSAGLSSTLYDRRAQNVLLSGLPVSLSNSTWRNGSTSSMLRQAAARESLIRPSKEGMLCFSSNEIVRSSISNIQVDSERLSSIHTSNPRVLDQCLDAPTSDSPIIPDLLSAHSLLSSNSWCLNEGESGNSMEGLMHANYNPPGSEPQHLSRFQSNNYANISPGEQGSAPVSLLQEYQLFKAPYNHSARF